MESVGGLSSSYMFKLVLHHVLENNYMYVLFKVSIYFMKNYILYMTIKV